MMNYAQGSRLATVIIPAAEENPVLLLRAELRTEITRIYLTQALDFNTVAGSAQRSACLFLTDSTVETPTAIHCITGIVSSTYPVSIFPESERDSVFIGSGLFLNKGDKLWGFVRNTTPQKADFSFIIMGGTENLAPEATLSQR